MSEQKLIFLDVDGVLNSADQPKEPPRMRSMTTKHVAELARVLKETDAKIVVSSAWRSEVASDGSVALDTRFGRELREKGDAGALVLSRIIGKTGDLWLKAKLEKSVRGCEIEEWILNHGYAGRFVILDDMESMHPLQEHLVKTDELVGLTPEIADEVIRRLNGVTP